jgi:uridine kinase
MHENTHHQLKTHLLQAIADAQAPRGMATKIVAVDGGGGAGKSTLAKHLSGWLGVAPVVITDDFASWGNPLGWWPRLLEQVLEPLGKNQPAHYQRYDWKSHQLAEWHDVEPGGIVILEGVSAMRKEFRPYLTYRIWVHTPAGQRLERGLANDRGIWGEDNPDQWQQWQAAEIAHYEQDQPEAVADLVVEAGTEHYHHRSLQPGEMLR